MPAIMAINDWGLSYTGVALETSSTDMNHDKLGLFSIYIVAATRHCLYLTGFLVPNEVCCFRGS